MGHPLKLLVHSSQTACSSLLFILVISKINKQGAEGTKEVIQAEEINLKLDQSAIINLMQNEPVWRPSQTKRLGDRLVPVHRQSHQHVVGRGQGVSLEKLKHLAKHNASQPFSVQYFPDHLACKQKLWNVWGT